MKWIHRPESENLRLGHKGWKSKTHKIMGRMGGVVMKTVVISKGVGVILVSP